jgi:large subunit ribosomal protein L29
MAKQKYAEKTIDELRDEENQLKTELFNMRLRNTTKELENTSKIRAARKDLARVLTRIRQLEIEATGAEK